MNHQLIFGIVLTVFGVVTTLIIMATRDTRTQQEKEDTAYKSGFSRGITGLRFFGGESHSEEGQKQAFDRGIEDGRNEFYRRLAEHAEKCKKPTYVYTRSFPSRW